MGSGDTKNKKIGLALGSGGARGFCHLGVLKALEENNIKPDIISGCSMGALVGGCYSAGASISDMSEMVKNINTRAISDLSIILKNQGFLKGNKAIKFVEKLVGDMDILDCKIPFIATSVNIQECSLVEFDSGLLTNAIRSSISIPVVFRYVEGEQEEKYVDGGIMERIPINSLKKRGADIVIAIDALGAPRPNPPTKRLYNIVEQSYLLLDWESSKDKIKQADLLVTPDLGDLSIADFNAEHLDTMEKGYEATMSMMSQIIKIINS